jgi:hypothetical protein
MKLQQKVVLHGGPLGGTEVAWDIPAGKQELDDGDTDAVTGGDGIQYFYRYQSDPAHPHQGYGVYLGMK